MKKSRYILVLVTTLGSFLLIGHRAVYQWIVTDHLEQEAPRFELVDLDQRVIRSANLRGKVVVLDFWTTWCSACVNGFQTLQALYERYQSQPDVVFLAINTGQGGDRIEQVRTFVERYNYSVPIAYDIGQVVSAKFAVTSLPTLFILDRSGKTRVKHIGYFKPLENLQSRVERHIQELRREPFGDVK